MFNRVKRFRVEGAALGSPPPLPCSVYTVRRRFLRAFESCRRLLSEASWVSLAGFGVGALFNVPVSSRS